MTSVSRFADLYRQVDPLTISTFSASLRPYGACVPCGPGYFKSIPGAAACTACPSFMDTFTDENGSPKAEHESLSGEILPGYLANVDKSACQCTLLGEPEGEATAFVQYYRLEPHESYECAPCPEGAVCDSRDVTKLSLLENRWRQNATTLVVFECPSPYSCKGGVGAADELCNVGYAGPVCGRCDSAAGYAVLEDSQALESSLQCTKCWPNAGCRLFRVFNSRRSNFRRLDHSQGGGEQRRDVHRLRQSDHFAFSHAQRRRDDQFGLATRGGGHFPNCATRIHELDQDVCDGLHFKVDAHSVHVVLFRYDWYFRSGERAVLLVPASASLQGCQGRVVLEKTRFGSGIHFGSARG
jgi:hypothetical protein